jgi:DNA-3-methyladenine glycosylase
MSLLAESFYLGSDVLTIAQQLLGKVLVSNIEGKITSGIIVETEAYKAPEDKASHAYNNRRTARTETIFATGGVAYVYLCYGMHHLFNIVTGPKETPHAILIRAIEPLDGQDVMLERRKQLTVKPKLTAGPGVLSQALGITTDYDGTSLLGGKIWLEDRKIKIPQNQIVSSPRIGVGYAQEFAQKPWRFFIKENQWVSG